MNNQKYLKTLKTLKKLKEEYKVFKNKFGGAYFEKELDYSSYFNIEEMLKLKYKEVDFTNGYCIKFKDNEKEKVQKQYLMIDKLYKKYIIYKNDIERIIELNQQNLNENSIIDKLASERELYFRRSGITKEEEINKRLKKDRKNYKKLYNIALKENMGEYMNKINDLQTELERLKGIDNSWVLEGWKGDMSNVEDDKRLKEKKKAELLDEIIEMGFNKKDAKEQLNQTDDIKEITRTLVKKERLLNDGWNINLVNWAMGNLDDPEKLLSQLKEEEQEKDKLLINITEMGFEKEDVNELLNKIKGDITTDKATEIVLKLIEQNTSGDQNTSEDQI